MAKSIRSGDEGVMRKNIGLNDLWKYAPYWKEEMSGEGYDESGMEEVSLPHALAEAPFNYFDESIYQKECAYRRHFATEEGDDERRLLLEIDGAAHEAEIFVNGERAGIHRSGYTAFTLDISGLIHLRPEADNVVAIRLDSRETLNIPPFGNVIDYMTFGGLYREVRLVRVDRQSIRDVFVRTMAADAERKKMRVETDVTLEIYPDEKEGGAEHRYEVRQSICLLDGRVVCQNTTEWIPFTIKTPEKSVSTAFEVSGPQKWSDADPALYLCVTELWEGGEKLDERTDRFGFREVEFREEGLYLNGELTPLIGLNRHQSFPYMGYAMPDRLQREDAEILKEELGVNAVRCSHYPPSKAFIDRCDELGLLVFMEMPGWQHIGDEEWKEQALVNVREMVLEYRNHPSIFLWGVRINESPDDDEFYARTNEAAHSLDPTRPTGGVRFLEQSSLLEDVYAYNDFLYRGDNEGIRPRTKVTPDPSKGYLISEHTGHMYPAKSFDDEEHRTEHARRHMKVLSDALHAEGIAGAFGWCMADYHTHKDFGSGDRICYHGVMDMYRNPKLAAYAYASQSGERDVFEISSTMDIGEHPACRLGEILAFTNADSVKLYKDHEFVKEFFPDREHYPGLPHPPVIIDDLAGCLIEHHEHFSHKEAEELKQILKAYGEHGLDMPVSLKLKALRFMAFHKVSMGEVLRLYGTYVALWGAKQTEYRFEAIKDGKVVKEILKTAVTEGRLKAVVGAGHTECTVREAGEEKITVYRLNAGGNGEAPDMESIRLSMIDQNGNRMAYCNEAVKLSAEGEIKIVGPDVAVLRGGMGGTYIKTTGRKGEGILTLCCRGKIRKIYFDISDSSDRG